MQKSLELSEQETLKVLVFMAGMEAERELLFTEKTTKENRESAEVSQVVYGGTMDKEQNEALESRLTRVEKQIQNQQHEMKNARRCMLCIGLVLALCQAVSAYNSYVERKASLTLAKSSLKNEQIMLTRTQDETILLKLFEKIMEFLSNDPEFQEFFRDDSEFLDLIRKDLQEVQGRIEDNE